MSNPERITVPQQAASLHPLTHPSHTPHTPFTHPHAPSHTLTHPHTPLQEATLVIQRMLRGSKERKRFRKLALTCIAVLTIQRIQRGRLARRSLVQAVPMVTSYSAVAETAAMTAAVPAAAGAGAAAVGFASASGAAALSSEGGAFFPALEGAALENAVLEVLAAPLMRVDAQVVQSSCQGSLDALDAAHDMKVQSPGSSFNALDNAMERVGPAALSVSHRPRPRPPYLRQGRDL